MSEEIIMCLLNGFLEPIELIVDFLFDLINIDDFIFLNNIQNLLNFREYVTLFMISIALTIIIFTNK
jgi:hypothetical protein